MDAFKINFLYIPTIDHVPSKSTARESRCIKAQVPVICSLVDSSKVIHTFPGQKKIKKGRKEGGKEGRNDLSCLRAASRGNPVKTN
jgi:hypothetical protein